MRQTTIAIIDDHPILREGLASLLRQRDGIDVLATGASASEAIAIVSAHRPDIVILDVQMPGDGLAAVGEIVRIAPGTRILMFTAMQDVEVAKRALATGASGFVEKGSPSEDMLAAIETVANGGTYVSQSIAAKVIASLRAPARPVEQERTPLTVREAQIVELLMRGRSNREIAQALDISEKTVKSYMTNLMQKFQARSRLEVVIAAQRAAPDPDGSPRARLGVTLTRMRGEARPARN
jgi:two-component system nitrate/nitrite response regulator NarL